MIKYVLVLVTSVFAVGCNTVPKEDLIPYGEKMLAQQLKDCLADEDFNTVTYYITDGHRIPTVDGRKLMVSRSQPSRVMPSKVTCEVTVVTNWGKGI